MANHTSIFAQPTESLQSLRKVLVAVALASLIAMAMAPIFAFLFTDSETAALCLLIAMLVFYRHKENIARIAAGTESTFARKTHA